MRTEKASTSPQSPEVSGTTVDARPTSVEHRQSIENLLASSRILWSRSPISTSRHELTACGVHAAVLAKVGGRPFNLSEAPFPSRVWLSSQDHTFSSLPSNWKTCVSYPMRQLVQQEYDASGSWRGPGQRKWDWPSTLGRFSRAVRMLGYCTRTVTDPFAARTEQVARACV